MIYDKDRFDWAYRSLLAPAVLVLVPEDDGWLAQGQDIDLAAHGKTLEHAKQAWIRCFLADVLLHAMTMAELPKKCPVEVWSEFAERPDAVISCALFVIDEPDARD